MNSWKSTLLSACAPPLRMFIIGDGQDRAAGPRRTVWRGACRAARAAASALARARAIETPSSALAPSRPLLGVPSSAIMERRPPRADPSRGRRAPSRFRRSRVTTAFVTPLPRYRFLSPSRSSSASRCPVDAPDGTAARPKAPPSSVTSTSTVGLPRESMISRPCHRLNFQCHSSVTESDLFFPIRGASGFDFVRQFRQPLRHGWHKEI